MSRKPASYGEILERTVPDPSGSFAPSRDERRQAAHRNDLVMHPMRPDEHALAVQVRQALAREPRISEPDRIEVVAQDGTVYLIGDVAGPGTIALVEDIVGAIHGVARVISDLCIPSESEP